MGGRHPLPRRDVLTEADANRVSEVFVAHQRFIENVAYRHAASAQDVPDIVQAVGLQVCRSLNGFRGDAELTSWLYRVTVNAARNHLRDEVRHQQRTAAYAQLRDEPVIDPDAVAIAGDRLAALQAAVQRLKPAQRRTVQDILHDDRHGRSAHLEKTTRDRRYRVRRRLRAFLREDPRIDE